MNVQIPSVLNSISRFSAAAGGVDVPNALTTIAQIDLGLVVAGQLINVAALFTSVKGVTPGDTQFFIGKLSGTGVIDLLDNLATVGISNNPTPANQRYDQMLTALGRVTTSGTYVLRCGALSAGSNSLCSGTMSAIRFNR